jgi:hypothetical protein
MFGEVSWHETPELQLEGKLHCSLVVTVIDDATPTAASFLFFFPRSLFQLPFLSYILISPTRLDKLVSSLSPHADISNRNAALSRRDPA